MTSWLAMATNVRTPSSRRRLNFPRQLSLEHWGNSRWLYARQCICIVAHMDAFQTLADQTRRQIVETLRSGEQQVNDIVDALDIHQSGVSRHLRLLLEAGFVRVRPDGQHRLYSLRPEPFRELEGWITSYQRLWDARLDRFGEALERRRSANTKSNHKEKKR